MLRSAIEFLCSQLSFLAFALESTGKIYKYPLDLVEVGKLATLASLSSVEPNFERTPLNQRSWRANRQQLCCVIANLYADTDQESVF